MPYYATSPSARPYSWPTAVKPTPPTPARKALMALATVVLGLVTLAFTWVATFVIFFAAGTYDGQDVTPANIAAAHRGQLALLVLAVAVGAPWLATAAQRRRGWQLEGVIGVLVMCVPLQALATHLAVTSWPQPFTF